MDFAAHLRVPKTGTIIYNIQLSLPYTLSVELIFTDGVLHSSTSIPKGPYSFRHAFFRALVAILPLSSPLPKRIINGDEVWNPAEVAMLCTEFSRKMIMRIPGHMAMLKMNRSRCPRKMKKMVGFKCETVWRDDAAASLKRGRKEDGSKLVDDDEQWQIFAVLYGYIGDRYLEYRWLQTNDRVVKYTEAHREKMGVVNIAKRDEGRRDAAAEAAKSETTRRYEAEDRARRRVVIPAEEMSEVFHGPAPPMEKETFVSAASYKILRVKERKDYFPDMDERVIPVLEPFEGLVPEFLKDHERYRGWGWLN